MVYHFAIVTYINIFKKETCQIIGNVRFIVVLQLFLLRVAINYIHLSVTQFSLRNVYSLANALKITIIVNVPWPIS